MIFKKLGIAIAVGALALGAQTASAGDPLRVGVEGAYPPFSEKTASGELIGFDIDFAHEICKRLDRECVLIEQDWDGMIPALLAKKFDTIIASMSITDERKKKVDFTVKYYNTPAKFAAKDGMFSDDSPAALAGKSIGVQRATTHDDFVSALYPDSDIKRYGTQDEAYLDLTAGRLDAILADSLAISDGFLSTDQGKGYSFFGGDHTDRKYFGDGAGVTVRKGEDALREAISKAITDIRADGTYDTMQKKYFDIDIYGG